MEDRFWGCCQCCSVHVVDLVIGCVCGHRRCYRCKQWKQPKRIDLLVPNRDLVTTANFTKQTPKVPGNATGQPEKASSSTRVTAQGSSKANTTTPSEQLSATNITSWSEILRRTTAAHQESDKPRKAEVRNRTDHAAVRTKDLDISGQGLRSSSIKVSDEASSIEAKLGSRPPARLQVRDTSVKSDPAARSHLMDLGNPSEVTFSARERLRERLGSFSASELRSRKQAELRLEREQAELRLEREQAEIRLRLEHVQAETRLEREKSLERAKGKGMEGHLASIYIVVVLMLTSCILSMLQLFTQVGFKIIIPLIVGAALCVGLSDRYLQHNQAAIDHQVPPPIPRIGTLTPRYFWCICVRMKHCQSIIYGLICTSSSLNTRRRRQALK
jgi:hypothetical protein